MKLTIIAMGLLVASAAFGSTFGVSTSYSQGCFLYAGVSCGQTAVVTSQANSIAYDNTYQGQRSVPIETVTTSSLSHLYFDASPGMVHAEADTALTFEMTSLHALGEVINFGSATVSMDLTDLIHFDSSTLAQGTAITYQITTVLDSTITGNCYTGAEVRMTTRGLRSSACPDCGMTTAATVPTT